MFSDKLAGFDGFNGPPAHVPVALMRPLVVIVLKPLIQVRLEFLHRGIELLPEGFPEELIEGGPVKSLYEAVGPGSCHPGATVSDIVELQKDLVSLLTIN